MLLVETWIDVLETIEAPDQQHGADDEDDRQRHFGGHQDVAKPLCAA